MRVARHEVPGYYRAVPPGRGRQTAIKLAAMGAEAFAAVSPIAVYGVSSLVPFT